MFYEEREGEFSVYQFFPDGSHECVRRYVPMQEAVRACLTYTTNVAAKVGITKRVIITDGDDFTNFEWRFGEGVVYPPELATKKKE